MASTSKLKQQWQMNQHKRNWLELPHDVTANILYRIGVFNILENAQKVCTSWRKICKDPAMWRVLHVYGEYSDPNRMFLLEKRLLEMYKLAVDRSQGQLVGISIVGFSDDRLLHYIANRSSQLKYLKFACCYGDINDSWWIESVEKFPLLEELSLYKANVSKEAIETVGRCCPKLKTLEVNQEPRMMWDTNTDEDSIRIRDEIIAIAISENLRELRHLELIGISMCNIGLKAILEVVVTLNFLTCVSASVLISRETWGKEYRNRLNV